MTAHILFHQFKHHLPTLRAWVEGNGGELSPGALHTIKTLGSSQLDMYCGNLSVSNILQKVACFLYTQGITENAQYRQWVGNGYKLMALSDGSSFTLRCIDNDKPVHIHPARHAPLTVRIKANSLKTVICCRLAGAGITIAEINAIRQKYLGLPPVGEGADIAEIIKVAKLLA